jgi:cyclophilin family peptidyl-prolyl cis-trans isomerase
MKVKCSETPEGPQTVLLTLVLDGYNAPVSAGQFMDLVQRKFYDGMEVQRADGFVVQTGDPDGPEDGWTDPATGKIRR